MAENRIEKWIKDSLVKVTTQLKQPTASSNQISPLFINHVLEQMFQTASLSDLKNFRLVCREWDAVAAKCLQVRMDLITIGCRNTSHLHSLHYQQQNNFFTSNPLVTPSMNAEQLNRFIEVISSSTNSPFAKYEITSSFFIPENQQVLHKFFQHSSPFIQVLKISLDNRAPGDFSENFLASIKFPKLHTVLFEVLRQFVLPELGNEDQTTEQSIENEIRDNAVSYRILSAISFGATNLESLEVSLQRKCEGEGQRRFNQDGSQNFDRDRRAGMGDGGSCLCQHFNSPSVTSPGNDVPSSGAVNTNFNDQTSSSGTTVKCHLPLPLTVGYNTTPPRISNSPKLKKLHLRLRNSFIHKACILSLLERLANTLEELCFTEEGHGSPVAVQFPTMKRLSKLTISSICEFEFEQKFVTILPFSYKEQIPMLRTLNLWDCFGTEKRYEQLFLSESPSETVTKLVLPSQFRNVSLARNIPTVFPRLKSLTMVFSTRNENLDVIENVFQCCGESLEELCLITDMDIQNQNVDHVLTGLPKEICRKMRMEENYVLPKHLQGMNRKPSLLNLKRLKKLIFQLEHEYSRAPLITDVTGYLAFMEMANLEYISFTRYGMSWTCCEALFKKCTVEVLSPNGNNVFEIENFDFDFEGM